jgi:hypothetical protein
VRIEPPPTRFPTLSLPPDPAPSQYVARHEGLILFSAVTKLMVGTLLLNGASEGSGQRG